MPPQQLLLEAIEALYPLMMLIHVFLCPLSSRQAGAAMAGAAGLPHHPELLPAPQSDRAVRGIVALLKPQLPVDLRGCRL